MSTVMHGWIELYDTNISEWCAIVDVGLLAGQSYNAYGCLFGVRNSSGFAPIAPMRGIPKDASITVQTVTRDEDSEYSPSWVTYSEIEHINWEEAVVDAYVHVYERLDNGEYAKSYSVAYIPSEPLNRAVGDSWAVNKENAITYKRNGELHTIEKITRRDALAPFQTVFSIMEILARKYGAENIRLVVWFDWTKALISYGSEGSSVQAVIKKHPRLAAGM